jgi:hypothetical protein
MFLYPCACFAAGSNDGSVMCSVVPPKVRLIITTMPPFQTITSASFVSICVHCLQGPVDGRLYRRKYVCESLMTLCGSAAANCLAGQHATSSALLGFSGQQQQQGLGMLCGSSSSSSSSLDWPIAQVMQQAVLLPGLASNLIRSSGLLQWLAAAAAADVAACSSSSSTGVWSNAGTMPGVKALVTENDAAAAAAAGVVGGSWGLSCLLQLLAARVALNKRDQAAEVFEAYSVAAMSVTAAALRPAGLAAAAVGDRFGAAICSMGLQMPLLQQLLALLVLLLEAAPNVRQRRQVMQLQLHAGVLRQLQAVVAATCSAVGEHQHGSSSDVQAGSVCQQLMAHLLAAARQQQ